MENNSDALDNFFDTKFSNQELKTRYEEFYQYLCENGVRRDFNKAKARDLGGCFDPISYGAAAFTINFLHKDKPLDENDKINEINAILAVFKFKLTENTTKSEIENISNTIEKIFLAIMSVDPKIFDIKSFDFFMSDDVTAERYMKIYDAAWAARNALCLVEKYLDILERNEKLDEQAEMDPDRKGNYNNLKVKLALNQDELEKVSHMVHQIGLLRNYTFRVLDNLFIHSDSLPIEMAEFAKSDLWDMERFKPIMEERGWQQAIRMRKSVVSRNTFPRDLTLDAIHELRDADLEKDIIKKLEMNILVSERGKPEGTKEQEKQETNLNQKVETEGKDRKDNSDGKENEQIQEKLTAQAKEDENQPAVNKNEDKSNENEKTNEEKDIKDNSTEKENEQIQEKSTAQVKEDENQPEVNKNEDKSNENEKTNEEKDIKDNNNGKANEQKHEESTAQIKDNEKENRNRAIIPKLNKKEILSTLTNQVKCFRNFSEFLNKLKNENLDQNIISGLACNNFSVLDMVCAFVWVVCHFWKVPKGIGVVDVARIKVAYDNAISGGTRDNVRNGANDGNLTTISELINLAIAKSNEEKNMASIDKETTRI